MLALEIIAERRIEEALARGELQGLAGEGYPLELWEDPLLPEEARMARRILRMADMEPLDLVRERGIRALHLRALGASSQLEGVARSALVAGTE